MAVRPSVTTLVKSWPLNAANPPILRVRRTESKLPSMDDRFGGESNVRANHERPDGEVARVRRLYLDLMKRALTHTLYRPMDIRWEEGEGGYVGDDDLRESVIAEISKADFDWVEV